VDAYWNSRAQSFAQHLFSMMTSWAVVCDVWFMDQQVRFHRNANQLRIGRAALLSIAH
jgi:nucleoside diphosphate kinase